MSFINLLANDVWSDADITKRTEALIRAEFSVEQEAILNRKATGAVLGQYSLSQEEHIELLRYREVSNMARAEGEAARADMGLLLSVMQLEKDTAILSTMSIQQAMSLRDSDIEEERIAAEVVLSMYGGSPTEEDIAADNLARSEAEAKLASASQEELNLLEARK